MKYNEVKMTLDVLKKLNSIENFDKDYLKQIPISFCDTQKIYSCNFSDFGSHGYIYIFTYKEIKDFDSKWKKHRYNGAKGTSWNETLNSCKKELNTQLLETGTIVDEKTLKIAQQCPSNIPDVNDAGDSEILYVGKSEKSDVTRIQSHLSDNLLTSNSSLKINAIDVGIREELKIECYIYIAQSNNNLDMLEKAIQGCLNPKAGK